MRQKITDLITVMLPLLFFIFFTQYTKSVDIEFNLSTPEVVKAWGYPIEIHNTTTEDGYILQLHRIPYGRDIPSSLNTFPRPVIFLQHGFLCSSFDWVANLPHQSAGFVFADAGFDVWLGNFRGNTYNRKHVTLDPDRDQAFWDWSWDQIAKYDLPAMIEKALEVSGQESLYYTGFSMGTLTMFAKLSTDPKFSRYIKKHFALAPVGTIKHARGVFSFLGRHFGKNYQEYVNRYGSDELFGSSWLFKKVVKYTCGLFDTLEELCSDITMLFVGTSSENWNQTRIPVYLAHTPAGSSSNVMAHLNQMLSYGGIPAFDMGEDKNLKKYGQKLPPQYNFSSITNVPIYIFWSEDDWLSTQQDLRETLIAQLNPHVVQGNYRIPNYNHLHFIWGTNAADKVYKRIIDIVLNDN